MRLRYTKRALADIDRIGSYLSERSPQGAANVLSRIEGVISSLADHPRSGRATDRRNVRVRVAGEYPYLVFYRVRTDGDVSILHVRHAERRPFAR